MRFIELFDSGRRTLLAASFGSYSQCIARSGRPSAARRSSSSRPA